MELNCAFLNREMGFENNRKIGIFTGMNEYL
jgi:hypothetical protein